jgi:large subunit ribosomal protein L35
MISVREGGVPKLKTVKAVKKRFRLTANGKVKHRSSGTSHLAVRMSAKRKRMKRGTVVVAEVEAKRITRALAGNSY